MKNEELKHFYEERYFQSWKSREITDGVLRPFSQAELEHIFWLDGKLKQLTIDITAKTKRVALLVSLELQSGNADFKDFEVTGEISMTYDDETVDEDINQLIDLTWKKPSFEVIHFSDGDDVNKWDEEVTRALKLYNDEQCEIGYHWGEMWSTHHYSLSWAFGHFFNNHGLFTVEDIMKIRPENFDTQVNVTLP